MMWPAVGVNAAVLPGIVATEQICISKLEYGGGKQLVEEGDPGSRSEE